MAKESNLESKFEENKPGETENYNEGYFRKQKNPDGVTEEGFFYCYRKHDRSALFFNSKYGKDGFKRKLVESIGLSVLKEICKLGDYAIERYIVATSGNFSMIVYLNNYQEIRLPESRHSGEGNPQYLITNDINKLKKIPLVKTKKRKKNKK